ncbi:MAG: Ppx/GppA family phosphatase [Rhodospirillales bacterium]|jgi:exopolyphosphatase/guanosine-5'-triphosphate,3'-diphosphate pyrophosphatase|nr:Ppx/GppA family phosphatase [Rhodospirillales bacterium]
MQLSRIDAAVLAETEAAPTPLVAVIDLGSNSIRLVVFSEQVRVPFPMFNEKVVCGLGRGVRSTGRLDRQGIRAAHEALTRYVGLARAMNVSRLDVLATAAVREADDGPDFVADLERRFDIRVRVLSGPEESRLAARGVAAVRTNADGIMGDLGGGSLDLVMLDKGELGADASLLLGHLWLTEVSGGDREAARKIIDDALAAIAWLGDAGGRSLFAVGGAWRTLAGVSISQSGRPLHVIDEYTISAREAADLTHAIARLSPATIARIPGVSRGRLDTLPLSALIMERLLHAARPKRVVFCAGGMREGRFFEALPQSAERIDPLIEGCEALARRHRRFGLDGRELARWMAPLFAGDDVIDARLRLAACHLSDIVWTEHPEYRGAIARQRILYVPLWGVSHRERILIALCVGFRYQRDAAAGEVAQTLLKEHEVRNAHAVGLALRLAFTLSGGVPDLLSRTRLKRKRQQVTLVLPDGGKIFEGEKVERRLRSLARVLGLVSTVTVQGKRRS